MPGLGGGQAPGGLGDAASDLLQGQAPKGASGLPGLPGGGGQQGGLPGLGGPLGPDGLPPGFSKKK